MTVTNEAQRTFWNDAPGRSWVDRQADLDTMHAEVTDLLLAVAAPAPGERVLDIGCGAGATSLALAEAVAPDGRVLGLDISTPLIEHARTRAAGVTNLDFELGDAQVWTADAPYDLAVSRFGVMFFDDPRAAFHNILQALRPGGRIALATWAAAERNPWFGLPMRAAIAQLGPSGTPPDPDAPGPTAFRDMPRVSGILRDAGFADVGAEERGCDLLVPGGTAAAADLALRIGPVSRHMRDKGGSEADLAAIRDRLRDAFAPFAAADGARIPARINIYRAARP